MNDVPKTTPVGISLELLQVFCSSAKLYIKRFPVVCLFRGDGWEGVIMPVRAPNGDES